jgi:hypothetical protein
MKIFNYTMLMKRLIFIFFAFVLVNVAYADTTFAANSNNTNTTNITDSNRVSNLNQTNDTNLTQTPTNLIQTSSNSSQTSSNSSKTSNNSTIKSVNVVTVQSVVTVQNIQGYFINPVDTPVTSINPSTLKAEGITDIFVYTVRASPQTLQPFITKFAGTGINVYAWVEAFKDFNGKWFNPVSDSTLEKQIIKDITSIATNYNINGVMLDYLRYPGTAYKYSNANANVNYFAASIKNNINIINNENIAGKHKILLSSTLMPEGSSNAYYYGQDYSQLSKYLDFLSPMIYVDLYHS